MEHQSFDTLILEQSHNVLRVVLNRPDKMNAFNTKMYTEMHQVLDAVENDPTCRVLIFTGAGKAFCAGGDIAELSQAAATLEGIQTRLRLSHKLALRFRNLRQPVIMAVNGAAAGAGLSMVLNGDLVIAAQNAKFSASFLKVGLLPDMGGIHNLVRKLGVTKACELSFLAGTFDVHTAEKIGVVNQVVEPGELDQLADQWATRMAEMPFMALGLLKKAIYKATETNFQAEVEDEINLQSICLMGKDGREGLAAFLEKRKPSFNL